LDTSQGEKTSTLCLRVKEQDAHTVLLPTPYSVNQRSSYQENVCALGRNRNFPKTPHLASAVDMLVDYAGHSKSHPLMLRQIALERPMRISPG
jgi:hypothetical protein